MFEVWQDASGKPRNSTKLATFRPGVGGVAVTVRHSGAQAPSPDTVCYGKSWKIHANPVLTGNSSNYFEVNGQMR